VRLKVKRLSGFEKITGLIGKRRAFPVFLNTRFGIHTFGLKFPIDVLILDKDNRVVKIAENLKPYKFFLWPVQFDRVIELPEGKTKKMKIKIGQKIELISSG
jgi:uncharacterized protein